MRFSFFVFCFLFFLSQGKTLPLENGKALMCAYKLCRVEFKYWGMQAKIERFIHDIGQFLLLSFQSVPDRYYLNALNLLFPVSAITRLDFFPFSNLNVALVARFEESLTRFPKSVQYDHDRVQKKSQRTLNSARQSQ